MDTGKKELISSPEKEQTRLRILLVDDQEVMRGTIRILFERSSVAGQVDLIEEAIGGQEALDILTKNKGRFNVVLTDGEMPGMGGLELARRIKTSGENITVGLMSGNIDRLGLGNPETQASVTRDHGISAVFPKSFDLPKFEEFMQKLRTDVTVRNTETQAPNPQ